MYENILLPYDGSEGAAEVLHHASEIAHWADATVQVVYVADTARDSVTVIEGNTVDVLAQQGEEIVDEAARTLETLGVEYDTDVVQGNPAPTIVEYAERYEYDLIVMPTHGREGVSRYLVGSVTEKVVRLSSVPVLTARMEPDEQLDFPYEDVLVPTDGSTGATRAGEHGLALAAALEATVHVVSVVEDGPPELDVLEPGSSGSAEEVARTAIDDLVAMAGEYDLEDLVEHVEEGSPVEGILTCIEEHDIDAVVMGTTGRRGTERILLGSVAEKTVRSAPVPVITVDGGSDETEK